MNPPASALLYAVTVLAVLTACGSTSKTPDDSEGDGTADEATPKGLRETSPTLQQLLERPIATRRAVVIGIDTYSTPKPTLVGRADPFTDLRGAVKDAVAMRELLVGYYKFSRDDILLLRDGEASRQGILDAIDRYLVAPAKGGDEIVFYFSGHGSEVENPGDPSNKDETLVPADSSRGALDIRDKELALRWVKVLDAGAKLTVILDSCHSGGMARGEVLTKLAPPAKQPLERIDLETGKLPENHPLALFLFASSATESALELRQPPDSSPRGAFTAALERALRDEPQQSVEGLLRRARASMMSARFTQTPTIRGKRDLKLDLVGGSATRGPVVFSYQGAGPRGEVLLQGGRALGLAEGARLQRWANGNRHKELELEITAVELTRARARIVTGQRSDIVSGTDFVVSATAPGQKLLQVHISDKGPSRAELTGLLAEIDKLRRAPNVKLVARVPNAPADALARVYFEDGRWFMARGKSELDLGATFSADKILATLQIGHASSAGNELLIALPPTRDLATKVKKEVADSGGVMLSERAGADYTLVGLPNDSGGVDWSWSVPTGAPSRAWRLPASTDHVPDTSELSVEMLDARLDILAKAYGWMEISSGAGQRGSRGPGSFYFRDPKTQKEVGDEGLRAGGLYELVLRRAPNDGSADGLYVYVINIDAGAAGTLVYPWKERGLDENTPIQCPGTGDCVVAAKVPRARNTPGSPILSLCDPAHHSECHLGHETFVILTADQPLNDEQLAALTWTAARTRGAESEKSKRGNETGLGFLVRRTGTRGPAPREPVPEVWQSYQLDLFSGTSH